MDLEGDEVEASGDERRRRDRDLGGTWVKLRARFTWLYALVVVASG